MQIGVLTHSEWKKFSEEDIFFIHGKPQQPSFIAADAGSPKPALTIEHIVSVWSDDPASSLNL